MIFIIYLADGSTCYECFRKPSFVSSESAITAESNHDSEKTVRHGLNELPVKLDIQIRQMWGNDIRFIYPGLSSAQMDDDVDVRHGGLVYKYNESHVTIFAPNRHDGYGLGGVVETGISST